MDKKNINSKSSPIQMRILMKRMREGYVGETVVPPKKNLNMRDMLKITRRINEGQEEQQQPNKKTAFDQTTEEEKFRDFFRDLPVNIKFIDLQVYDNMIFWGGTVNGVIQFVYRVTPDEKQPVEFNYLEDFSPDNPQNDEIVGRIESYYDTFFKYWRNNMLDNNK